MIADDQASAGFAGDPLSIIDRLKCFNAKERYWVVREALGHFHPSDAFVRAAAKAAGVEPPTESAHSATFLAMDYHLNWLCAALGPEFPGIDRADDPGIANFSLDQGQDWARRGRERRKAARPAAGSRVAGEAPSDAMSVAKTGLRFQVENSQEDVDLLLAYVRPDGVTQIILVEAKCTSGFTEEQIESKAIRLSGVLDGADLERRGISVKLVLMSPRKMQGDETLKRCIAIAREHCGASSRRGDWHPGSVPPPGYEYRDLVPVQRADDPTVAGWMPLAVRHLDPRGFWVVEFSSGKLAVARNAQRMAAGARKERWFWERWYLRRRKPIDPNIEG